ncbi:hypothetical protein BgiBS90_003663, partial [Biomphalaria glabrata]
NLKVESLVDLENHYYNFEMKSVTRCIVLLSLGHRMYRVQASRKRKPVNRR